MARRLEAQKKRLDADATAIKALQNAVRDEQVSRLTALHQAYQIAQAAAAVVAGNMFTDDPLPHIGSEVWRALWETARLYSEQHAYPDTRFPFTGDAARCVLCQQELDAKAVDRFNRFEGFVRDETKRKEEGAAAAYRTALDALATADVPVAGLPVAVALNPRRTARQRVGEVGAPRSSDGKMAFAHNSPRAHAWRRCRLPRGRCLACRGRHRA